MLQDVSSHSPQRGPDSQTGATSANEFSNIVGPSLVSRSASSSRELPDFGTPHHNGTASSPLIHRPKRLFGAMLESLVVSTRTARGEGNAQAEPVLSPKKVELSQVPYSAEDAQWVRNALKLTTKFLVDEQVAKGKTWGPTDDLPMVALTGEIGLLLAASGVPPQQVAAAMLYSPLQYADLEKATKLLEVVERKFGRSLTDQLVQTYDILERPDRIHEGNAHLACAILLGEISCGHVSAVDPRIRDLATQFRRLGVNELLLDQLDVDLGLPLTDRAEPYSGVVSLNPKEVIDLRNAVRYAGRLFKDADRKWGPNERLPLMAHATEVALILAMAGQSNDLVVAGLLHDALEGYSPEQQEQIAADLKEILNENTVRLIQAVTEPQKAAGGKREHDPLRDFYSRKMSILKQVEEGDREVATLSCSTKISTIGAGLKHLWITKGAVGLAGWSSGTLSENLAFFKLHEMQYRIKGVPPQLLEQFHDALGFMVQYLPQELNSAGGEHPSTFIQ
ncbi:MAG: HD domain-containing protein [Bdellovibrionales bacterium]|nr:HD domain-containing protein [Bdellovibrionales bacterium]